MKLTSKEQLPKPVLRGTAESVAEKAGVSVYTVSRVFTGTGRISDATRKRVLDVARELNYAPNPASRALRSGRLNIMAFVLTGHESLLGEFYTTMLAGMQKVMGGRNMDVLLSILPEGVSLESWIHNLTETRRCGALSIVMEKPDNAVFEMLRTVRQPLIVLNVLPTPGFDISGLDTIGFDNGSGIEQAVLHLHGLGHRSIAYFGGTPGWQDSVERESGFRRAALKYGIKIREEWIIPCQFTNAFASGSSAMDLVLGRSVTRPTAVVCASDEIALGAMSGARKWGLEIPTDVSITGFDNVAWCGFNYPPLTSIEHSGWMIGMRAANLLLRRYQDPELAHEHVVLPTQIIVRQSTAAPASTSVRTRKPE